MYLLQLIAVCGILFISSTNCSPLERRAASNFSLYAYGANGTPGGSPVFYADGVAYIGLAPPSNASISSNVTFAESSSNSSIWMINSAPSASNVTGFAFGIDPASSAFDSVQFVNTNATSSFTTSGFMFYGSVVFWVSTSGDWESLFYATPTGQNDLWALKWNSNSTSDGSSFPITLKNQGPGSLASVDSTVS